MTKNANTPAISQERFLEFNGKKIFFKSLDGVWWIAIKPICEALDVNYNRQFQNLKQDRILGPAFAIQQMQMPGDQPRNWASLPEFFVYGWIFSIQSESHILQQYKWKCYELLYNYFHGVITERTKILREKTETEIEIFRLEDELQKNETYQRVQELKKKAGAAKASLTQWDKEVVNQQLALWQQKALQGYDKKEA